MEAAKPLKGGLAENVSASLIRHVQIILDMVGVTGAPLAKALGPARC